MDNFESQLNIKATIYVDDIPFSEEFWVREFRFMTDSVIGKAKEINKALRKVYNPEQIEYKFEFFEGKADGMRYSTEWRKRWERTLADYIFGVNLCYNWNLKFEGINQTPKDKKKKK